MNRTVLLVLAALVLGGLFIALRPNNTGTGPQARTIDVRVTGDTMQPARIEATAGDTLTLAVTTDHPIELHVHHYDIEAAVAPGDPVTLEPFVADATGTWPIEDHAIGAELGTLVVNERDDG